MKKLLVLSVMLMGCARNRGAEEKLFIDITAESGIDFINKLSPTEDFNPYIYRNFYNGGGVAVGDINNDGLEDIYFTGNQVANKLYLNKGNFKFEDITEKAGVSCTGVWSTGATIADINGDGLADIYVCKSGKPGGENRHNQLFINNGNLTFTDRAKEFGLDVIGLSVQAAFFDFDKDNDLDCYLLTNSFKPVGNFDLVANQRDVPDPENGGNKFFINDSGRFIDYSSEVGIYRSNIGFGLGITLGDFNHDQWTDIFISNDFFERDYLYINDQKGSFKESLTSFFSSISMGSMGADFADLDNDGLNELFVTEMLPDSLHRKQTKIIYENWNKYQLNVANSYHHQFARNVLQKAVSNGQYAEIGRMANVAATEWSWGALLFDMDNDGLRDIFVANGIRKDLLDRDYLSYTGSEENIRRLLRKERTAILKLIDLMPASAYKNYAFHNSGNLSFENKAASWGLDKPMYSNGSAYADFDNDGDLDLVVNNLDAPSVIYRNGSDQRKNKFISIEVAQSGMNTGALGTTALIFQGRRHFSADNFITRGYQSSVTDRMTIGLGNDSSRIDSIQLIKPQGGVVSLYNINTNALLKLNLDSLNAHQIAQVEPFQKLPFALNRINEITQPKRSVNLNDFNRERLLPFMYSHAYAPIHQVDVNGDGRMEVYLAGNKDEPGKFLQFDQAKDFVSAQDFQIIKYSQTEESVGVFFDADQDGDQDYFLAAGGRSFGLNSKAMTSQLWLNSSAGNFVLSTDGIPETIKYSLSKAIAVDVDLDKDLDLVLGIRYDPLAYGRGGGMILLENDGHGKFSDVTNFNAPEFRDLGMITDFVCADLDGNTEPDLIIIGDWMPVHVFLNHHGKLESAQLPGSVKNTSGWWNVIRTADLNKDNKPDFVLGNYGLNSFFKSGDKMFVNDFDRNGSVEQIFARGTREGKYFPLADRDDMLAQLPYLKKDLLYYKNYGNKSVDEIFTSDQISASAVYQVDRLESVMLLSGPQGYTLVELPSFAQYAPIYAILISDFDNDGIDDILAAGNQYRVKPQFGRQDASAGWFFKGSLNGTQYTLNQGIDLGVKGEVSAIELIEAKGQRFLLFGKYDALEIFKVTR
jgi:hypothetical protein